LSQFLAMIRPCAARPAGARRIVVRR
jgi:hypothetical protein